jgi:hypothetical protein
LGYDWKQLFIFLKPNVVALVLNGSFVVVPEPKKESVRSFIGCCQGLFRAGYALSLCIVGWTLLLLR